MAPGVTDPFVLSPRSGSFRLVNNSGTLMGSSEGRARFAEGLWRYQRLSLVTFGPLDPQKRAKLWGTKQGGDNFVNSLVRSLDNSQLLRSPASRLLIALESRNAANLELNLSQGDPE